MKKIILTAAILLMSSMTFAAKVPAKINYLSCSTTGFGIGGVSITFVGNAFTITEITNWGVPFSQIAVITNVSSKTGKDITFNLRGTRTNLDYKLKIESGTGEAEASTVNGTVDLVCTGDIQAI